MQEKRSAYAPGEEQPVRYDGIYRIARAYRKPGQQGQLVCRYLFIRADNEPAPWSSEGMLPCFILSNLTKDVFTAAMGLRPGPLAHVLPPHWASSIYSCAKVLKLLAQVRALGPLKVHGPLPDPADFHNDPTSLLSQMHSDEIDQPEIATKNYADTGDKPWDGEVPEPVLKEIKEAKGKVHSMGSSPWW